MTAGNCHPARLITQWTMQLMLRITVQGVLHPTLVANGSSSSDCPHQVRPEAAQQTASIVLMVIAAVLQRLWQRQSTVPCLVAPLPPAVVAVAVSPASAAVLRHLRLPLGR
jgi:hypothetical protein